MPELRHCYSRHMAGKSEAGQYWRAGYAKTGELLMARDLHSLVQNRSLGTGIAPETILASCGSLPV